MHTHKLIQPTSNSMATKKQTNQPKKNPHKLNKTKPTKQKNPTLQNTQHIVIENKNGIAK